jgi:GntR family transcriptional regulator, galactonate operon transcriptional repressor
MSEQSIRSYPRAGIHGRIVHDLGAEIGSGGLKPGDRLPMDAELTQRFKASRTATREALKVLASKGLIEARQRAGTFVRPRDEWDLLDPDVLSWLTPENIGDSLIDDLMEMREVIEPVAARFAADRATSEDLSQIEEAYARMVEHKEDVDGFYHADRDFHLAVLGACHNQFIDRMSSIVGTILGLTFRMQSEVDANLEHGLPAHQEVLDRIRAGDRRGAEKAMRATIGQGRRNLDDRLGRNSRRRRKA